MVIPPETWVGQALTLIRPRSMHSLVVDLARGRPASGILTPAVIRDMIVAVGRDPAPVCVSETLSAPATFGRPERSLVRPPWRCR